MSKAFSVKVDTSEIRVKTKTVLDNYLNAIGAAAMMTGTECVNDARDNGSYNDITGNLRSSIGSTVLHDGETLLTPSFKQYKGKGSGASYVDFTDKNTGKKVSFIARGKDGDGSEGMRKGAEFLATLVENYKNVTGFVILVSAGMDYARYVEEIHGKNVLTSAFLLAKEKLPQYLSEINKKDV